MEPNFKETDISYWERMYQELLEDIKKEFKEFEIIQKKTSRFSQMLGKLAFWNKEFNTRYTTTIGPKIYVNHSWNDRPAMDRWRVLIHERIHMRQTQKYGLLSFFLVFGLFPLPAKLAYFRRKWEWEAYRIGIYVRFKRDGIKGVLNHKFINFLLDQFCGPFYMWTWHSARDILRDLVKVLREIKRGDLTWEMLVNHRRLPRTARPLKVSRLLKLLYPDEFS
ncbi:MAG: hypothetical protein ACTSVI_14620 [Promethearchaeota archaeon]